MDEIFQADRGRTWKARTKDIIKKRLPILKWMPKYRRRNVVPDIVAGMTVWLTAVPQSLAYAGIAGLSPEYGLYSQFVGPFVYVFLGSCRQMTIGPTAIVQLFTFEKCGTSFPDCVVLMGFYSGVVELFLGIVQLGFLVSFISEPVTVGFTAGAVFVIASGQIKSLLGLSGSAEGNGFVDIMEHIINKFTTISMGDSMLGIISLAILLLLRDFKSENISRALAHSSICIVSALTLSEFDPKTAELRTVS